MASLRDVVSEYQDDLRNGIAWLAFWREGRSWQAEAFHLDLDDTLYPEDRARLAEIQAADPRAIVVNGYYSGYLSEEMSVAELAAGVRHHYDNGLNNIAPFMEAHSDELPPDVLEAAREKAHAAGLPFYERPYRGDDIDPYCDSFGFTPVPEFFLQREKQLTPRELLTGESIQTPRGSFLVTDMSREQLEAAGYGFHHQSEDGKYLIMGNGTDAFAIPAQQESPIKAAEMTTEQNYNMIDGVLNNAPTMSELEAKAKAGEQISLFDVAEAAKAEAQKPKQPQRPAQKQKKPSIRAQLKAAKEEQQKKPPQREKAQELEV